MKIELELVISKNMHMFIPGKLDVKSTTTQIRLISTGLPNSC